MNKLQSFGLGLILAVILSILVGMTDESDAVYTLVIGAYIFGYACLMLGASDFGKRNEED